ncbi:hypothetical protein K431DRAFT_278619 [Polychaeton citri CBS 116435]|uniref:F-box domain-containing protein n=1 Tax=Polychaeton citri CBS 116435 TaxID=1314669 RepID=A0A9P4PX98_9PEZI|nr:hypothetical protein K431DRAFT_278619 [Polychaeton citri CBS 116435]
MSYFGQSLRRVSTNEVFRRSSRSNTGTDDKFAKRRQTEPVLHIEKKRSDTSSPIFDLPAELHAAVLAQVSFKDLCALRLVSQAVNDLLTEGEVVRQWASGNLTSRQLALQPMLRPVTFAYLLEQQRRLRSVEDLSRRMAAYVENDVLTTTIRTSADHKRFQLISQRICSKLVPALQVIQHYLEAIKQSLIDLASATSGAHCSWDRRVVDTYTTEDLLQANQLWHFIVWMLKQVLKNPSYATTVERAMKGWHANPPKENDLYHFLVFGNLEVIGLVLELRTNRERRKAIDETLRRLNPNESIRWQHHWKAMGPTYNLLPTEQQALVALGTPLTADVVWVDTVRAVLEERGAVDAREGEKGIGTPAQALEFMNEIAGYDVLHAAPPEIEGMGVT